MTMGEKIKILRNNKLLQQKTLAEAIGVSSQTVENWESDVELPQQEQISNIALFFRVPVRTLMEEDVQPLSPNYALMHHWEVYSSELECGP